MTKQNSKQSKNSKNAPRAQAQLDAKRAEAGKLPASAPTPLTVVEQLNAGMPVAFPKGANAVKVTIDGKTTVMERGNVDTLKGTGVTAVEFGHIPNDSKGHPQRDKFQALSAVPAGKATKPAKTEKTPQKPAEKPANGNPYPTGSKRAAVYDLGFAGYKDATALVEKVVGALKCGKAKAERLVKLVADPKARFNGGSKEVKTDGGMKLIAA